MYNNKRKISHIRNANISLEQRYLKEQAPPPPGAPPPPPGAPPPPPGAPPSGSQTTREPIKPMEAASKPKSIKDSSGNIINWEKMTDEQKNEVAKKCGHDSKETYEKEKWKCAVQEKK